MSWLYLLGAGLFEIGWPVGLKLSQVPGQRALGLCIAIACMAFSGALLWLAQREITIGTAYAVWTGIGAVGTVILGIVLFGESASLPRLACVAMIIAGIAGLKFITKT